MTKTDLRIEKHVLEQMINDAFDAGAMYQGAAMSGLMVSYPQLTKMQYVEKIMHSLTNDESDTPSFQPANPERGAD